MFRIRGGWVLRILGKGVRAEPLDWMVKRDLDNEGPGSCGCSCCCFRVPEDPLEFFDAFEQQFLSEPVFEQWKVEDEAALDPIYPYGPFAALHFPWEVKKVYPPESSTVEAVVSEHDCTCPLKSKGMSTIWPLCVVRKENIFFILWPHIFEGCMHTIRQGDSLILTQLVDATVDFANHSYSIFSAR
eukprot:Trichotokara_eunicae@DN5868_c0_g1_i1.p1